MEFTNEIFFNKPLTAGNTVIITYSGKLYREHSKDVSIVYGYNDSWEECNNCPMIETDNGFEVTLTIKDYSTFNFCFTNSFNIWDNNSSFNYIAPISKVTNNNVSTDNNINSENVDCSAETNTNTTIENNTAENSISSSDITIENNATTENTTSSDTSTENTIITDSTSESSEIESAVDVEDNNENSEIQNSNNFENSVQDADVENAFSTLIDSLIDSSENKNEKVNVENLSGFGLQSVDSDITEEEIINCDDIFAELFDELTLDKKESLSAKGTSSQKKNVVTEYDKYDAQELDKLMDNLLTSISTNNINVESTSSSENNNENLDGEHVDLPATLENEDWLDKIINMSYNFSQKVTSAFKKFGNLLKCKAIELGIINEK